MRKSNAIQKTPFDLKTFEVNIHPLVSSPTSNVDLSTLHRMSSLSDVFSPELKELLVARAVRFETQLLKGVNQQGKGIQINALRQVLDMNTKLRDSQLQDLSSELLKAFVA